MKQRLSFHILHLRTYSTRQNRRIITLDPTKLVQRQQTAIDLSNIGRAQVSTPGGRSHLRFWKNFYGPQAPFPSGTRGFLYYYSPSDRPRIAGQLRFRVTPSEDPISFPHGHDLTLPHTRSYSPTPWSIPLLYVLDTKCYAGLLSHLVYEGLVEESLVESIREVGPHHKSRCAVNYLFKLSDPFEFNYINSPHMIFQAVTESGRASIIFVFGHQNALRASKITFKSGRIKACFERSILPEHEGKRVVVLCNSAPTVVIAENENAFFRTYDLSPILGLGSPHSNRIAT
ncbi:hypothetical protein BJ165DRAFT_1406083 [Panaeolus papilionaceus]|nr:hypothetical protein BJ165DRAFT_1406083 [Panaeolus papilionaceus]